MFRSLRIQLGAIVFCFVLLAADSVAITYPIAQTPASGAMLRALLLVAALLLLAWGCFFTRRRLARPLATLNRAASFEFSQQIVSQLDLWHLLQSMLDQTRALTWAEAASGCLLDEGNTAPVLSSSSKLHAVSMTFIMISPDECYSGGFWQPALTFPSSVPIRSGAMCR